MYEVFFSFPICLVFCTGQGHNDKRKSRPQATTFNLSSRSIGSAIHDLLVSCNLSGHLSDTIKAKLTHIKTLEQLGKSQETRVAGRTGHSSWSQYPDWEFAFARSSSKKQTGCIFLYPWLHKTLPLARKYLNASRSLRDENNGLLQELCGKFGLREIKIDPEWTAVTLKGHLHSLQRLLQQEKALANELACDGGSGGVTLVLGYRSCVDLHGHVYLSCEETVQQWSQV